MTNSIHQIPPFRRAEFPPRWLANAMWSSIGGVLAMIPLCLLLRHYQAAAVLPPLPEPVVAVTLPVKVQEMVDDLFRRGGGMTLHGDEGGWSCTVSIGGQSHTSGGETPHEAAYSALCEAHR